ncbi:MAG: hypothetical protein BWX85_01433 [Chloroflexi bacterium ADurb.Bin120]|nr:MAG: hypothetical protein BWX85_01433 [Chloroflexi bacterium ADurb.Bin120]
MPQQVCAALLGFTQGDIAHQVNQAAQVGGVQVALGVHLGQNAFQRGVLCFDGVHGIVDIFSNFGLPGAGLQIGPAGGGGHKEHVFRAVFVPVFGVGAFVFAAAGFQPGV